MTRKRSTASIGTVYGKRQDRYLELIRRFPLRPIKTDAELDDAIKVIDSLIDQAERSDAEEDYLDVLSDMVIDFEDEHIPMRSVPDHEMLRYLIELKANSQSEVARDTGIAESTVSEVLSGKRKLNRRQIGKLARYFKVDPGVFAFGE